MPVSDQPSDIIASYVRLLRRSSAPPEIAAAALSTALPLRDPSNPCALLLSPHPDDECLTGALPLRLKCEQGWQIINIALTLGSNLDRRAARQAELAKACAVLGFDGVLPIADGFSDLTTKTRDADALTWLKRVARLAELIAHYRPDAIFLPHAHDANPTHIGAHFLGMDALAAQSSDFSCCVAQTEYWHPNEQPNLMIGIGENDTIRLLSALACHQGEVQRNPFDLRLPAYLIDNVRRGSERVGGKGVASAPFDFAMLYKFGLWREGRFIPSALNRVIGANETLVSLFS